MENWKKFGGYKHPSFNLKNFKKPATSSNSFLYFPKQKSIAHNPKNQYKQATTPPNIAPKNELYEINKLQIACIKS